MDFERLIPLLVIYIVWRIISKPRKKAPQQQKTAPAEGRGIKILRQVLSGEPDQEELEAIIKERAGTAAGLPAEEITAATPIPSALPRQKVVQEAEPAIALPKRSGSKEKRLKVVCGAGFTRRTLKNAVIWSELLAKPLALRDDQQSPSW